MTDKFPCTKYHKFSNAKDFALLLVLVVDMCIAEITFLL